MRKSALLYLFFIFATSGISCGHDDYFDEELIYRNDSIIHSSDSVKPPYDSTSIDTTKKDSTISDTTQTDTAHKYKESIYIYEITRYMNQTSSGSVQGADCYGDYLFQFQDKNAAVFIYNLKEKKFIGKVTLTANSNNHCNNASFSRIFFHETDEFPLIYVSGSNTGLYNQIQVYRITRINTSFSIEKIQEIILPKATPQNNLYWTYATLDPNSDHMYITSSKSGGGRLVSKIAIPKHTESQIYLTDDDIIDSFDIENFDHHQGSVIKGNHLYIFGGVPAWGDTNHLSIIDLQKKGTIALINIMDKGFKDEAEGAFIYENCLFCAANRTGIYKFVIKDE